MKDDRAFLIERRLEQAQVALDDAKFLLDGKRSAQSVINRAYYAMFYAAHALLQKIGKAASKHAGVIGLFDTEFAVKGILPRELSKDFHKAFELRQASDYKASESFSLDQAKETYERASRFVGEVRLYLLPLG